MRAINYENKNFDIKEPFQSLFTQGNLSRNLQR